ncbi:MAG: DUF3604 domain-containing protein [Pseudomonadales bacterium]|jgi:hypothetical protein|nr:DUF3604 domain-containing protein [Pseudomonadales bacterium]|tara:strand:+ start:1148 stop:3010 length:1863 start_codon:yes stop_codon:yes gene_type:complete
MLVKRLCLMVLGVIAGGVFANEHTRSYSPNLGQDYPTKLLWGDTHLHTNLSVDAAAGGNTQFGPDEAYRLARGEVVKAHNGMAVRLNRPLDFLVAADHAETMGLFPGLDSADPLLLATKTGKRWYEMYQAGPAEAAKILIEFGSSLRDQKDLLASPAYTKGVWHRVSANADRYNEPGKFSAFIGYEWSSGRGGANMHRIVMFADGADRANQVVPFSSYHNDRPRALWRYMADYEATTGGQVLAIPHNSNVSAGLMFALTDSDGNEITDAYAKDRSRWEPLMEVTQFKGDSETHPYVSPEDEFADYESWDKYAGFSNNRPHENEMFAGEYARPALRRGLALFTQVGANPYKFGLIGSTDSHTGIASADENNFWGKFSWHEPKSGRATERFVNIPDIIQLEWEMAASGYAAVWAQENTRASIFAALRRKETYATTGPRINVRIFGGWQFTATDLARPNWAEIGYGKGVPMGGDLATRPEDGVPTFLISAMKDPIGANLDRVQVIKGWVDANGETAEKIYDVALSDGRQVSSQKGRVPKLPSTVNVENATYTNSVGAASLQTVWQDAEFDASHPAFYYVRVIEIQTPRWTAYDAKFFNESMPSHVPMTTQERAYTSPIWYTPK